MPAANAAAVGPDAAARRAAAATVGAWKQGQPAPAAHDVQLANLWALDQSNDPQQKTNLQTYLAGTDPRIAASMQHFVDNHRTNDSYDAGVAADAFRDNPHVGTPPTVAFSGTPRGQAAQRMLSTPPGTTPDPKTVQQTNLIALEMQNDPAQRPNLAAMMTALPSAQGALTQNFLDNHQGNDPNDAQVQTDAYLANTQLPSFGNSGGGAAAAALSMYETGAEGASGPTQEGLSAASLWLVNQAKAQPAQAEAFLRTVSDPKDAAMLRGFMDQHKGANASDAAVQSMAATMWQGVARPVEARQEARAGTPAVYDPSPDFGKAGQAAFQAQRDKPLTPLDIATLALTPLMLVPGVGMVAGMGARLGVTAARAATAAVGAGARTVAPRLAGYVPLVEAGEGAAAGAAAQAGGSAARAGSGAAAEGGAAAQAGGSVGATAGASGAETGASAGAQTASVRLASGQTLDLSTLDAGSKKAVETAVSQQANKVTLSNGRTLELADLPKV